MVCIKGIKESAIYKLENNQMVPPKKLKGHFKRTIMELLFDYSKDIRIYDSGLKSGFFDFYENKDLLKNFYDGVLLGVNKKLEILLNRSFNPKIYDFLRSHERFFENVADLRITEGNYDSVIIGDGKHFIVEVPGKNYFGYSLNNPEIVGDLLKTFEERFSLAKKIIL